jgi:competence ComEA-like helix-hairpin-helix protein
MEFLRSFLIGVSIVTGVESASPRVRESASPPAPAAPIRQSPVQERQQPTADDPSTELFVQMCNRCHDASRITAIRRTKTEWEEALLKMIERGAQGSEEEFETVFAYLRRHYGKVYINSATADDITTSLGLSGKDAEAILAYRKANGSFADFDAVKKVPNIDVKTLEEHKDAVAF